jgi:catechol 2,3-dioxygenase-like lactoylglutathione lyase family enzyme
MEAAPMSDENPSILSHISLGTDDFNRARAFYDAVMPTLGARLVMEHPGAAAYGRAYPEFWIQTPHDGGPAGAGNGTHVGFMAPPTTARRASGPPMAPAITAVSCATRTATRSRPPSGTQRWRRRETVVNRIWKSAHRGYIYDRY